MRIGRLGGPAEPRRIVAAAGTAGVAVDFVRAAPFRALAAELGTSAALAHRCALSLAGVDSGGLGVENRIELAECVAATAAGPLPPDVMARIDAATGEAG